jgi:hypothetical protein
MNVEIGTEAAQFLFWKYFRYCVFAVHKVSSYIKHVLNAGAGAYPRGEGGRGGGAEQRHLWLPFRNRLRHYDDRQFAFRHQECAHKLPPKIRLLIVLLIEIVFYSAVSPLCPILLCLWCNVFSTTLLCWVVENICQ